MFFSTRNKNVSLHASEAILQGLSLDGGLFLPDEIHSLKVEESLLTDSYQVLAYKILRPYLDDYSDEEVRECISLAYDEKHFQEKIMDVTTFSSLSIMELFHSQTLTFKDMALSLLPYLMQKAKKKHPSRPSIKIITATSGDTGSAVLSSFSQVEDIKVSILYPENGISPIQEKQMLYFTSSNARAYALKESNFDDCQTFVKTMLVKHEEEGYTSANSINIGRLLPQIVYYYYTYLLLVKRGVIKLHDSIDVVVPTGNFGDILAGYFAKLMGLPIDKLIIASNENKILTDFFTTGVYDLHREFMKTNSPSMDILISSNLERLLFFLYQDDKKITSLMNDLKEKKVFEIEKGKLEKLKETFLAYSCDEKETLSIIHDCFMENHYLLDPHSAVSYGCTKKFNSKHHVVSIATASPLKFPSTIATALALEKKNDISLLNDILKTADISLPSALKKVLDCSTEKEPIDKKDVEDEIFAKKAYIIKTGATSANIGPGFDVLGLALKQYNIFRFEQADETELCDFAITEEDENLVLTSYQYPFKKLGLTPVDIKITQVEQNIPLEGGLGSSSSCIIAGLLGANEILHHRFTKEEILKMAVELEGHMDNVAPCLYGGFGAGIRNEDQYRFIPYEVNPSLKFITITPKQKVKTQEARKILPSQYPLADVTFNFSHLALLPYAFKNGDIALLKQCLEDKIHVPYRKRLIDDYEIFKALADKYELPFTISGSGSTMLVILKDEKDFVEELKTIKTKHPFSYQITSIDEKGASVIKEVIR